MSTGKAMQYALRGGIDMSAAGTAPAGGVQLPGRNAKNRSGYQQRHPGIVFTQEKAGGEQDQSHSHTGKNGPALSLPTSGGILR